MDISKCPLNSNLFQGFLTLNYVDCTVDTFLWVSLPPTHAAIVLASGARTPTERGVAMATARAEVMQGFGKSLGLFMTRALASLAASWALARCSVSALKS